MTAIRRARHARLVAAVLLTGLVAAVAVFVGLARSATAAAGDAKRGEQLFGRSVCVSCHDITKPWPGGDVCPNLGNIATEAARIVKSREYKGKARDAAGYIRESIANPNAYIVPGPAYRTADGKSVMPQGIAATLKPGELEDLVAYLMTRR